MISRMFQNNSQESWRDPVLVFYHLDLSFGLSSASIDKVLWPEHQAAVEHSPVPILV